MQQGFLTGSGVMCADTELEAEVEPSLETEQRLAAEEAAQEEAARNQEAELARLAQDALAQAAEAERQRAQQEADLERLRQVMRPLWKICTHISGKGTLRGDQPCEGLPDLSGCMLQLAIGSGTALLADACV